MFLVHDHTSYINYSEKSNNLSKFVGHSDKKKKERKLLHERMPIREKLVSKFRRIFDKSVSIPTENIFASCLNSIGPT